MLANQSKCWWEWKEREEMKVHRWPWDGRSAVCLQDWRNLHVGRAQSQGDQDEKILEGEAGTRSGSLRGHILYSMYAKIKRFLSWKWAFQGHWDNVMKGHVLIHCLQITGKHTSLSLGFQATARHFIVNAICRSQSEMKQNLPLKASFAFWVQREELPWKWDVKRRKYCFWFYGSCVGHGGCQQGLNSKCAWLMFILHSSQFPHLE